MVTHMQGSTVSNLQFQCTTVHFTVNKMEHIQFLLRLMVTMLCRIRLAETGFDALKIMILNLRIKNVLAHRKKFEDKELEEILDEDRSQTLAELGKKLQVDESTVSKRLKVLGMIQKQGH